MAKVGFRLVAAVHLRGTNDCCYRKQSLPKDFREGPLYPLKLPVESDHCQVTALACADLVLSTLSSLAKEFPKADGYSDDSLVRLHSSQVDSAASSLHYVLHIWPAVSCDVHLFGHHVCF